MPEKTGGKLIYVVVSIGLVMGLFTLACWLWADALEPIACGIANIDTPENCP